MKAIAKAAQEFADAFEVRHRDNGQAFHCLKDGTPQWISDAVYRAHENGDLMPNDWTYRLVGNIALEMAERMNGGFWDDDYTALDEIADYVTPSYNHEALDWLASHAFRVHRVDELIKNDGFPESGLISAIIEAIRLEALQIGDFILDAVKERAEELELAE